ncbi:helix-turn-helix domain-containing protein [Luteococcus sp. Sow4_B9]|uniref:helix-turn-helix domain-containing protein n=1 Tax=Luteococcus sp. Sow4_B9 TaxID=3438792 RepID=UPI003F954B93
MSERPPASGPLSADPASAPNVFAQRLTAAIARRGLSLHRIQTRLTAADLKVSTATLSYWASGRSRPTRGRSLDVVRALEQILDVEAGHLVRAMTTEVSWEQLSDLLPQANLPAHLERLTLQQSMNWHRLHMHDTLHVQEETGTNRCHNRQVSRAEVDGLDSWVVLVQHPAHETPSLTPLVGLTIRSCHPLPEQQLSVIELALPRPLRRGETIYTEHQTELGSSMVGELGRALSRACDLLVLEARFHGERPTNFTRSHLDPRTDRWQRIERSLMSTEQGVQCVVPNAAPGTHLLSWYW